MGKFVDLNNAERHDKNYKKVIERIVKDNVCPFCPENFAKYHKKPVLKDGQYWILTENMYPYRGARHHLLAIHRAHIEDISQISKEAWDELLDLVQAEAKKRNIKGGTFYIRFGDTSYTGASVTHLHANLVSPDVDAKDRKPLMVRVG